MSIDLVGSTALKQTGTFPLKLPVDGQKLTEVGAQWVFDLASFYTAIEAKFARHWRIYCESIAVENNWPVTDPPTLWKANGDELIYVKDLSSAVESVAVMYVWMTAAREYRQDLRAKRIKLDVKLTAWTAGFPITNSEVILQSTSAAQDLRYEQWAPEYLHYHLLETWHTKKSSRNNLVRDFIGPSIDAGFRLAAKASPRKFIVGIELAMLWSVAPITRSIDLGLYFDGMCELKGVFGGRPYPIFWIDTMFDDELTKHADKLTEAKSVSQGDVQRFCMAFVSDHDVYMFKPFIQGAPEIAVATVPENYNEIVNYIRTEWSRIKASEAAFERSFGSAKAPGHADEEIDQSSISTFRVKEP